MNRRIVILGTGAVGRWLSWILDESAPVMVGRTPPGRFRIASATESLEWEPAFHDGSLPWAGPAPDFVFVTVKWAGMTWAREWLDRLPFPRPAVLTLLNGMGQEAALAGLGLRALNPGVSTVAVTRYPDGGIAVVTPGLTSFAADPAFAEIQATTRPLPWEWLPRETLEERRWLKLLQNAVINPLSALGGCKNGELMETPLWGLGPAILEEGRAAAAMEQVALPDDLWSRVRQLALATAENRSSMLQDVLAGRPTEIGAINGYIVRRLAEDGRAAPVNASLCRLIEALIPPV